MKDDFQRRLQLCRGLLDTLAHRVEIGRNLLWQMNRDLGLATELQMSGGQIGAVAQGGCRLHDPRASRLADAGPATQPSAGAGRHAGLIIDSHAHVRAVVWGHVHQAYDGRRGDVRLLATPSTGAQFLPKSDRYAVDSRPPAYRHFDLHSDGRIDTAVHWLESLPMRQSLAR